MTDPVIAGVASIPSRVATLREAFSSIYWQVDEVYVFLNDFDEVPGFLQVPGVKIFRSQDYEDYQDVGKFFALTLINQGIFFAIDDDILYPSDYVAKMLTHLESTGSNAVVGVHGIQLPRYPKSFFDRHVFTFWKPLSSLAPVSMLGTGTVAFDIATVGLKFSDFTSYGMADVHLAAYLKKTETPALVVPRPSEWLIELKTETSDQGETSLYEQARRDAAPHNATIRAVAPWGEEDIVKRWRTLPDPTILSDGLTYALAAIELACTGEERIFKNIQVGTTSTRPFMDAVPWIDIFSDANSRYRIYSDAIKSRSQSEARRKALDELWALDKTEAINVSREIAEAHSGDSRTLIQHAKFCVGYYLVDEAEEYFLHCARLPREVSHMKPPEALFEYFNFLVAFEKYDKAEALASTLQRSHGNHSLFNARMVLVAISKSDLDSAEKHLTSLVVNPGKRRRSSIKMLLRSLSDSSMAHMGVKLNGDESYLVSGAAIDSATHSAPELVDLLKIATLVGDYSGARSVWNALSQWHERFLKLHPELEWFYTSTWANPTSFFEKTAMREIFAGKATMSFGELKRIASLGSSEPNLRDGALVSVLMTAFNSENTIDYAVESILNQSHGNLELIIVDDKSADETLRLARKWAEVDTRVTVVPCTTNAGPYVSRNIGLQYAQGEFVAIQDADDVSLPDRLELQLERFLPETKAVLGRHVRMSADGAVCLENDGSILGHGPMTLVFRREVVSETGAFAEVRTRGDKEFESRVEHFYGAHALARIPDLLVCSLYEQSTNSRVYTNTYSKKRELMIFKDSYSKNHSGWSFNFE